MRLTRRELAAAGLALGAGCLSGGSNVRYPGEAAAEGEPLVERDGSTAAATDGTAQAPPNPDLAPVTRGIYTETRWFATGYEPAMRAFRNAADKALSTVQRVREQGEINANTLDVVDRAVERLLSVVESRVEPHFNVGGYIEGQTNRHLEVARTFAGRGDIDRAQEELGRLASFLEALTRSTFANRNLSRNPVRNRLLSFLRVRETASPNETPGELFEVWDERSGFTTYAYGGPSRVRERTDDAETEAGRGAFDERDRSLYRSRFAPTVSDEREGAVYVLARRLPSRPDQPDPVRPEEYPANAIAIQRFADVSTASEARRALVEDGPLSVEGTARLGRSTMDRVYYRAMGDVMYAYVLQTAELLVVVAPTEVAWNERIDWARGLKRTWLWSAGRER
ncbi:MAG: hypothetical protein ABEH47_02760 [Haloferacaceae archaeon]